MKYSEYREQIKEGCFEEDAWNLCREAEDDPEISREQEEKLYNLYHLKWDSDETDEDFELANFCHGGDLKEG